MPSTRWPCGVVPERADAAADEAARHRAEPLGVEIAQIDDVNRHGRDYHGIRVPATTLTLPQVARPGARLDDGRQRRCSGTARSPNPQPGPIAMPAQTHLFLCLQDNFGVLVHDPATGATASIDAPEAAPVEAALEATGWRLTDILVTHHHADHTDGIVALKEPASLPRGGAARRSRSPFRRSTCRSAKATRSRSARSPRASSRRPATRSATSPTVFHDDKLAFVGDTLFSIGCGRVIEGTPAMMWQSLQKLRALPDDTQDLLRPRIHRGQYPLRADDRAGQRGARRPRRRGRAPARRRAADHSDHHRRREARQPVPARRRRPRSPPRLRWPASRPPRCLPKSAPARTGSDAQHLADCERAFTAQTAALRVVFGFAFDPRIAAWSTSPMCCRARAGRSRRAVAIDAEFIGVAVVLVAALAVGLATAGDYVPVGRRVQHRRLRSQGARLVHVRLHRPLAFRHRRGAAVAVRSLVPDAGGVRSVARRRRSHHGAPCPDLHGRAHGPRRRGADGTDRHRTLGRPRRPHAVPA